MNGSWNARVLAWMSAVVVAGCLTLRCCRSGVGRETGQNALSAEVGAIVKDMTEFSWRKIDVARAPYDRLLALIDETQDKTLKQNYAEMAVESFLVQDFTDEDPLKWKRKTVNGFLLSRALYSALEKCEAPPCKRLEFFFKSLEKYTSSCLVDLRDKQDCDYAEWEKWDEVSGWIRDDLKNNIRLVKDYLFDVYLTGIDVADRQEAARRFSAFYQATTQEVWRVDSYWKAHRPHPRQIPAVKGKEAKHKEKDAGGGL